MYKIEEIEEMKNVLNLLLGEGLALHELLDLLVEIIARFRGYRIHAHLP